EASATAVKNLSAVSCTRVMDFERFFEDRMLTASVRAAFIALPNHLHERAIQLCLDAGLDVLCEKPLATDAISCRRLAEKARKLDRRLGVGMVRRFVPSLVALRSA